MCKFHEVPESTAISVTAAGAHQCLLRDGAAARFGLSPLRPQPAAVTAPQEAADRRRQPGGGRAAALDGTGPFCGEEVPGQHKAGRRERSGALRGTGRCCCGVSRQTTAQFCSRGLTERRPPPQGRQGL